MALSDSLSVNIWSIDNATAAAEDIFSMPIPLEEEWSLDYQLRCLVLYIRSLAQELELDFAEIKKNALEKRFLPLTVSLKQQQDVSYQQQQQQQQAIGTGIDTVTVSSVLGQSKQSCREQFDLDEKRRLLAKFENATNSITSLLKPLDPPVRMLFLLDLIEEVYNNPKNKLFLYWLFFSLSVILFLFVNARHILILSPLNFSFQIIFWEAK